MWMVVIAIVLVVAGGTALYIVRSSRNAERRKYYDAAYKMVKESYLDNAINRYGFSQGDSRKVMLYLKWKDTRKRGFVFDPERHVRIGRNPGENEICIQENDVSRRQCVLYLAEGRPAIQDLRSTNGTWIKRGLRKHPVQGAELLFSGDLLMIGSIRIKVTIFMLDVTCM